MDTDDEVVNEIDVYLSKTLVNDIYVLQVIGFDFLNFSWYQIAI